MLPSKPCDTIFPLSNVVHIFKQLYQNPLSEVELVPCIAGNMCMPYPLGKGEISSSIPK